MPPVILFDALLVLLAVAVALALVARKLRVPPAAAYLPGGMILALVPGVPAIQLDPALSMTLFLPPLIQASAFFTVWRDFRANLRPILLLAVGCVAFTTFGVGVVLKYLLPDLPWAACFTLGAIVSPPDAVAAAAVLERLHLPRRLMTVLEGESLVNDASGLVLYRFAAATTLSGAFSLGDAMANFVLVAAGGIAIGFACGHAVIWATRRLNDTNLEIAASFLAAYGSYLAAEAAETSGVLACVTCGLVMGWRQHATLSALTRLEARATWTFIVFVLEALVFVLIGLSLHGVLQRLGTERALALVPATLAISIAVIVLRVMWVYPGVYVPRLIVRLFGGDEEYPPPSIPIVVSWAGMRGVVSLAAALALPDEFPGRDPIEFITFGVIFVTVLGQGTTLGPLIKRLGITGDDDHGGAAPYQVRARVLQSKLSRIDALTKDEMVGAIARDVQAEYRARADSADPRSQGAREAERSARLSIRLEALAAGRDELLRMHRANEIHDNVLHRIEHELDLEELGIRRRYDS